MIFNTIITAQKTVFLRYEHQHFASSLEIQIIVSNGHLNNLL